MATYISILRGINVGGNRTIKMDALKQLYASLNFTNIKTYIQSGNVIFELTKKAKESDLEKTIEQNITKTFGFDVPVLVIEVNTFKSIIAANPFTKDKTKDKAHLHITFLSDKPTDDNIIKIKTGDYKYDEFAVIHQAVYLYCPNGYSNSKLTNTFLETKLKVSATTRNWKTCNELIALAEKA